MMHMEVVAVLKALDAEDLIPDGYACYGCELTPYPVTLKPCVKGYYVRHLIYEGVYVVICSTYYVIELCEVCFI